MSSISFALLCLETDEESLNTICSSSSIMSRKKWKHAMIRFPNQEAAKNINMLKKLDAPNRPK